MTILIVEDDPTSIKLTSVVLQADGHALVLAQSADQAMLSIKAVKPDIILLDMRLPGIHGLAVVRQCREEPATKDIPIIAITADPSKFSKQEAMEAGCNAYIVKPINTRTILSQVNSLVAAAGAAGDHSN